MKGISMIAVLALFSVAAGAGTSSSLAGEKALCLVCKVTEGQTDAEAVKEWRTHEGVRYGLCSQKCAKEFEADPAAYVPPVFPRPAPDLSVTDLAGRRVTWDVFRDKVVLVDFWATWCAPCRKSMPELQGLHDRYAPRGFTVLGVSIDERKAAGKVKKFVASKKIRYPIALDAGKTPAWERFHVKAVPAAYLVDRDGRIVAQWTGAPANVREVEEKLGALLGQAD